MKKRRILFKNPNALKIVNDELEECPIRNNHLQSKLLTQDQGLFANKEIMPTKKPLGPDYFTGQFYQSFQKEVISILQKFFFLFLQN